MRFLAAAVIAMMACLVIGTFVHQVIVITLAAI